MEAEMNYSCLDAQISVPAGGPNRRRDVFRINRRQLLSVTYLREIMDGEYEPIYALVQQAEIYLNLFPFVSSFELQVYVEKAFESIKVEDLQYSLQAQELMMERTTSVGENSNVIHEAKPLSYKLPNTSVVIRTMLNNKRWAAPRPYTGAEHRNLSIDEKKARLEQTQWLQDWIIEPRQRNSGKYDFFYYHKKLHFMCRSLVEVHSFELNGTLPKRSRKLANKDGSSSSAQHKQGQNVKPEKPKITTPSHKRTFDQSSSSSISPDPGAENRAIVIYEEKEEEEVEPDLVIEQSVEDIMRDAYNNLISGVGLNPTPNPDYSDSTDDDCEEDIEQISDPKLYVEEFLKEAHENLGYRDGGFLKSGITATSTPMPIKASEDGKKRGAAEEISTEREGKKLKTTDAANLAAQSTSSSEESVSAAKAEDHDNAL